MKAAVSTHLATKADYKIKIYTNEINNANNQQPSFSSRFHRQETAFGRIMFFPTPPHYLMSTVKALSVDSRAYTRASDG